jgi:AbrB family looped-hinge helix DNA binding protein
LVVPAEVRDELGLVPGDELTIRVEDRRIILEAQSDARARLRGFAAGIEPQRSLVDELLAERRAAARAGE